MPTYEEILIFSVAQNRVNDTVEMLKYIYVLPKDEI